jgi:hypothetical protein
MSGRILLVTGSRVLVATTHEERAKAMLTAFCEAHAPTMIVVGDADGPDEWAATWAATRALDLRIYALDGWVHSASKLRRPWSKEPRAPGTFCKPLDRNAVMVRETAEQRAKGAHVEVVGLEALWSTTHGTAHTLGKAKEAGLAITRITFERSKGQ